MGERSGRTALITGASAGLGAEFARLFAADGHDVVLVARRRDRLEALAADLERDHGVQTAVSNADLTDPGAPRAIERDLTERAIPVEFLVNNAGFGTCGAFAELDADRELAQIQVNVAALAQLSRLLLPPMLERGSGRILNVGSTAGFQPGPYMAVYYATKAFVNSFSEALSHEVANTGVTVTVSCPGATRTEFSAVAGNDGSRLFRGATAGSDEVASEAYRAMMAGRRMIVHGAKNRLGIHAQRMMPRSAVQRIAGRLNSTPDGG